MDVVSTKRAGFFKTFAVTAAVLLLAAVAAALYLGTYLAAPAESPVRADLIVSLGGDTGHRAERAAELFQAGYAPHVLLTSVISERDPRLALLKRIGVPPAGIHVDSTARNSWQEARLVRRLMEENGWRRVLVVSDPPHLRRLNWSLRQAFEGAGFEYRLVSSQPAWWHPDRWWANSRARQFALSELVKLTYYHLRYP